jgi:hypothetical protein
MSLVDKIKKQKELEDKELALIKSACKFIANSNVDRRHKALLASGKFPPSSEYKKEYEELILTATHSPDELRKIVNDYVKHLDESVNKDASVIKMLEDLNQVNVGGELRADAAKNVASHILKGVRKFATAQLDVENTAYNKPTKKGLSRFFTSSRGEFNPNTASTEKGNETRTIDRDLFNDNRMYRQELEADIKRMKKRGGLSTEELTLIAEHNKLKKEQMGGDKRLKEESDKILDSMTSGEKAMYDAFRIPSQLFGMANKGLNKLPAFPSSLFKSSPKEENIETSSVEHNTTEASQEASNTANATPDNIQDLQNSIDNIKNDPTANHLDSANSESYDAAAKETSYENATEYQEKQLDKSERQIESIKNVQAAIERSAESQVEAINSNDSGSGIISTAIATLGTTLGGILGKLASVAGPVLMAIAATKAVFDGVSAEVDGKHVEKVGDIVPEGMNKINPFAWAMNSGRYVGNKLNGVGASDLIEKGIEFVAGDPLEGASQAGTTSIEEIKKRKADSIKNVETTKKDVAPKLDAKTAEVETVKESKKNTGMAGAISNVVNNSPNNVIAPPSNTKSGRDNPRNPDNSLSLYLKSRVTKFF